MSGIGNELRDGIKQSIWTKIVWEFLWKLVWKLRNNKNIIFDDNLEMEFIGNILILMRSFLKFEFKTTKLSLLVCPEFAILKSPIFIVIIWVNYRKKFSVSKFTSGELKSKWIQIFVQSVNINIILTLKFPVNKWKIWKIGQLYLTIIYYCLFSSIDNIAYKTCRSKLPTLSSLFFMYLLNNYCILTCFSWNDLVATFQTLNSMKKCVQHATSSIFICWLFYF